MSFGRLLTSANSILHAPYSSSASPVDSLQHTPSKSQDSSCLLLPPLLFCSWFSSSPWSPLKYFLPRASLGLVQQSGLHGPMWPDLFSLTFLLGTSLFPVVQSCTCVPLLLPCVCRQLPQFGWISAQVSESICLTAFSEMMKSCCYSPPSLSHQLPSFIALALSEIGESHLFVVILSTDCTGTRA